jgi:hypothetical protein
MTLCLLAVTDIPEEFSASIFIAVQGGLPWRRRQQVPSRSDKSVTKNQSTCYQHRCENLTSRRIVFLGVVCTAEEGPPNGSSGYCRNVLTYLPKGILLQEAIITTTKISKITCLNFLTWILVTSVEKNLLVGLDHKAVKGVRFSVAERLRWSRG